VNGIESDVQSVADVIRIDLASRMGREIGGRYSVTAVPTTVVLDAAGQVIYQHAGIPDRSTVVQVVMG